MSESNGSGIAGEDMDASRGSEQDRSGEVRRWVDEARRIVVLTGAGISTDSGIPDFRGPNGVWTKNPEAEKAATLQHYLADPDVRRRAWETRLASPAWDAQPNAGHRALVDLERRGKLHAIVTQNVDELHQRAGTSPELVIEVHGTMYRTMCWSCGVEEPMAATLERVRAGDPDPACPDCGGILKSATISFGQQLVPEVIERAMRVAEEADLLLAVGSTLQVYPAASVVPTARAAGARVVIVNAAPTPFDPIADAVLRGSISEVLPAITSGSP
ncbi:MAG TPA: Sir2 family NAD-dependent protein deacetylase [Acidimicrobiales bacterium]|nr:Sir2 family NAD-dependent protein deacetylase [Acidimicrobiales bacterium]